MKILVYGAGIQGSYLAHALNKGDNQVTLLARGKRKKTLLTNGLVVNHSLQCKQTKESICVIEVLQPKDHYDLIFVTMKFSDFPTIIDPLAKNNSTTIIFIGNQMNAAGLEEALQRKSLKLKDIYFGFQLTGGMTTDKGVSVLRFGKGRMKIGALHTDFKLAQTLDDVFSETNYAWKYEPKIDDWLKSHATMVMIQNSFEYLYDFSAAAIRKKGNLSTLSYALKEGVDLLAAGGSEVLPKAQNGLFQHPALAKLFYTLYYRLPISKMVQGNFNEVYELMAAFEHYQMTASPRLDSVLQAAKEKYEKTKIKYPQLHK